MKKVLSILEKPIDIAPLVYARIVLGVLISLEFSLGVFTNYGQTLIQGNMHFSYLMTGFIEPWSSPLMIQGHFMFNFILGILFAMGFYYRWVTPLFLLSGASLFLMEKSLYINHFYLYSLILFLFLFLPANRGYSFDSWRKPQIKVSEVPAWTVYILLFQLSVVYFYSGIAKINADWFQAQPVQIWLGRKADYPLIGGILSSTSYAYIVAYGGLLFDLLIVPSMLYRPTRKVAFFICCFFHLANVITFGVGTFPWFSMAATALFFAPSSFRKWKLRTHLLPVGIKTYSLGRKKRFIYLVFSLYMILQLLVPLRLHLYPGNASWTEQGHFFAWRMMLRTKQGSIKFTVKDAKSSAIESVKLSDHLNKTQIRKIAGNPDFIVQFAHYLKEYYLEEKNYISPEIYAENEVSLNGRERQAMIPPGLDLGQVKRDLSPYSWIIPQKESSYFSR